MLLVLLCLMSFITWSIGLFRFAESIPVHPVDEIDRTDAIVVLTGGSGRLEAGLDLLVDGAADRLFVSGVYQGIDVITLLEMFRDNPEGLETRVEIGNATNTRENATETAEWVSTVNAHSIRLVTAGYHMPRSMLEFRSVMPDVAVYPYPVFPEHVKSDWWLWPGTAGLVLKEYNKYLFAWGRIALATLFGKPGK
ncbi:MAG: YdcF family protein [Rhodospirillales bacterium]|nr:YdcF family protein [Rhodospirillales bacterium]